MIPLEVFTHGDECWLDLKEKGFITGQFVGIARLPGGTVSGRSSVTVRIELPDGRIVLAETTLRLLKNAVAAFMVAEDMER